MRRLANALARISEATSLSAVLDRLGAASALEAGRTALFVVNGASLHRWQTSGFAAGEGPEADSMPEGALADVLRTGLPGASSGGAAPPFAADATGLVIPLLVGDRAVAVLYADDAAGAREGDRWQDAVGILGQHGAACLARITAVRTSQAFGDAAPQTETVPSPAAGEDESSARRYARLLVSEIKLYNESAVRAGRDRHDILSRLKPEIDRARRFVRGPCPFVGARSCAGVSAGARADARRRGPGVARRVGLIAMYKITLPIVAAALLVLHPEARGQQAALGPTVHQALPSSAADLWLVPSSGEPGARTLNALRPLVDGAAAFATGDYAAALPLVSQAPLSQTELRDYAAYYTAASQLRLSRSTEARSLFHLLRERKPQGYLSFSSAIGEAEAAEALGDYKAAIEIYESLASAKATLNEEVLARLGRAALAAGDRRKSAEAWLRVTTSSR